MTYIERQAGEVAAIDQCYDWTEEDHQKHVATCSGTVVAFVGAVPAALGGAQAFWFTHDVIPHNLCRGEGGLLIW